MTAEPSGRPSDTSAHTAPKPQVDTSKPHPARVYDWLLGGKDNYAVDQEVGRNMPEVARAAAHRNRAFMRRATAWLAGPRGVGQFLDIGTGIPTEPNLHQVAQRLNPRARVVYTDNDPIVLRHAEALLVSTPEGATDYIQADVKEPAGILEHARKLLDFDRPVALSLIALMHFVPDDQDPYGLVRTLTSALPSGSYLMLSHVTADEAADRPDLLKQAEDAYRKARIPLQVRDKAAVTRFFDGLDLVDPGVVPAAYWVQPDAPEGEPAPVPEPSGFYVAVGRVP